MRWGDGQMMGVVAWLLKAGDSFAAVADFDRRMKH